MMALQPRAPAEVTCAICRPLLLGAYLVVSNGGMAGSTVVPWAPVFMSDAFTAMPDGLSDIVLQGPGIFMLYTI